MAEKHSKNKRYFFLLILSLLTVVTVGITISSYIALKNDSVAFHLSMKNTVVKQTSESAAQISQKLLKIQQHVIRFSEIVTASKNKQNIESILKAEFEKNKELFTLNVTFKPFYFSPERQYFSPYYQRISETNTYSNLTYYDKDLEQYEWYHAPMQGRSLWTEPYFENNGVHMTTFSVPFYESASAKINGEKPIGVIPSDVSLSFLTTELKKFPFEIDGYAMLFSNKGKLISHPISSFVRGDNDVSALVKVPEFNFLTTADQCIGSDYNGVRIHSVEQESSQTYLIACTKVANTDWTLITKVSADAFKANADTIRRSNIELIVWGVLSILLASFLYIVFVNNFEVLWSISVFVASLFMLATILVWVLARVYPVEGGVSSITVSSIAQREAFEQGLTQRLHDMRLPNSIFLPTGIAVESLEFITANNVKITGFVWHKFPPQIAPHERKPFLLPEAVSSEVVEVYRESSTSGVELIGWRFNAQLRQSFDYFKYPFDQKNVWIRLWPGQFGKGVVLVPDFESYSQIGPGANMAIIDDIVLNGWSLKASNFNYIYHQYNSNFGLSGFNTQGKTPELYYSIMIERNFISPFVTSLLPFMIIASILFITLQTIPYSSYGEIRDNIIAIAFTILLAHYSMRERLSISEVVYFEYFYFLLYLIIFSVMVIGHQYFKNERSSHKNHRWFKLLSFGYWPVLSSTILLLTLSTYY
tara:strand:- start:258 stop:2369 length:2112 start_codon:yes stop_codon:yes gene_type:complete